MGPDPPSPSPMPASPDHQLGASLRLSRPPGAASRQQLGSMLRDLVGGEPSLLPPLQHLIAQPSFLALDPRSASRAQRLLGRDQLLAELGELYQPRVLERLRAFLEGYLDLEAAASAAAEPLPVIGGNAPAPANPGGAAAAAPEILPPGAAPPRPPASVPAAASGSGAFAPAAGPSAGRSRQAAAPRSVASAAAGPQRASPAPSPSPPASPSSSAAAGSGGSGSAPAPRRPLPLVLALGLLAGLGLGVAFRLPVLCQPLGLCPAPPADPPQAASAGSLALARGQQAAEAMNRASTLKAYDTALADLERELLRLWGDPLTPEQLRQRDQLQATAREGQQRLGQERQQAQLLTRATERIDGLASLPAEQQPAERQAISGLLAAIPERSFAHGAARDQLSRLSALPLAPPADPEPAPAPSEATAPPAQPAPAPPRPAPLSPSQEGASPAPYRDQPLF